jgi:citron Rho-interacting kinase
MLRTLEQERKDRQMTETAVVAQIRLSKATWKKENKQEIAQLEKQIEIKDQRIVELCTISNTLSSKVDRQTEELKSSCSEIEMLRKQVQEDQHKIAQAREKNRRSVVVVESKLESIAADSQSQLATLQSQLADEVRLRSELQEQLHEFEDNIAQKEAEILALQERESSRVVEMRSELESCQQQNAKLQKQVNFLQEEANCAFKALENSNKAVIRELEEKLHKEKQDCQELRKQLLKVEGELSESLMSQENTLATREVERESHVAMLEAELKQAGADKMKLQHRLQEALDKEEEDTRKLETLEGLLKRLEQGLVHLEEENLKLKALNKSTENVSSHNSLVEELEKQKVILLAQVEKLELQVQKMNEMSLLDKQTARTCQHQLWKKEKELSDVKLDVRIAQREAKTAEDQVRALQEEKQKWGEKLQAEINAHAEQLQGECDKVDKLNQQVVSLSSELQDMKQKEEAARKQVDVERALLAQKMMELDSSKSSTRTLQHELEMAHKQVKVLEQQVRDLQTEAKRLSETISHLRDDKVKLGAVLEDQKRRNTSLELNNNCLKELCTLHDDELEDAEKLLKTREEKEAVFKEEKKLLQAEIESLQQKFQKACQDINEEKSLRIRAESRNQGLETELQAHTEDVAVLQSQIDDYHNLADERTTQVTELEDRYCASELELRNVQRQLQASQEECIALKEELTQYLTQINSVKESNFKLNRDLEDSSDQIQQLNIKYSDLEATLTELQAFYKQRETKSEATIQQQTKLIDYLQNRMEDANKKKKTLTDKLFGHRQKEPTALVAAAPSRKTRHIASHNYQQTSNRSCVEPVTVRPTHGGADAVSGRTSPVTAVPPITSLSKKALTHLVQSPGSQTPGCFVRQPSLQRMHHNIPHRFDQKLCVRAIKCAACLDSIHFGHYAFICQECDITAHPKCSLVLPSTCGIPSGFARHFSQSWKISQVDSDSAVSSQSAELISQSCKPDGYVKIPKRGKSCWEHKYLRLEGSELQIFDHEPTSEMMTPSKKFMVCRPEGTTSILSSVPYSDVVNTAKSDLPFIFKVEVSPRTTCWPGSSLLIMALSFSEKQSWVSALEAVVQGQNSNILEVERGQPARYQGSSLLCLDQPDSLDLNCCLQLSPEILLLGAEEGLFSYRLKEANAKPVRIQGLTHVHQMSMLPLLNCLIILAGEDRILMQCDLRQVRISAEAAECVKPSITAHPVLPSSGPSSVGCCLVFGATTTKDGEEQARTTLCAATEKHILLLRWNVSRNAFQLTKTLDTKESCSCIHFARHSIIVGCNRFFEIDIRDFSMEEFLDPSDKSLAHVVFGAQQLHIYPVAILDVTRTRTADPEYLLCFNVFGVFVDKYGQRTRQDDIKWSHLPLGFAYRKPYLFILHFSSVEVMKLSDSSFMRSQDDSSATANHPQQTYIELNKPRFLGPVEGQGPGMYVGHCTQTSIEILIVKGTLVCREDNSFSDGSSDVAPARDGADLNSYVGSEFSFTSSLARSLENITDSVLSGDCESIDLNNQHRTVHFSGV